MDQIPSLPSISALFLTHFDDIKGQTTIYFRSIDSSIKSEGIEHVTLPSGLHLLESDIVTFNYLGRWPGAGLFRNRTVEGGRGRRMGTLGVIISSDLPEDLFELKPALEAIYDELEEIGNPFEQGISKSVLDRIWNSRGPGEGVGEGSRKGKGRGNRVDSIRVLVEGRGTVSPDHPIAYLPSLLAILGPLIIPVYKAVLTGKRVLIYSQPPLLPVGAFAWCIAAMALAPASIGGTGMWLGNVGLMDLADLKERKEGWVATTSDAIFRSHAVYDLFLDLSTIPAILSSPPSSSTSSSTTSRPHRSKIRSSKSPPGTTYHLSDLPLYRSLLMMDSSPPSISLTHGPSLHSYSHSHSSGSRSLYIGPGGWWLLAFDIFSSFWALCVGVCEYAVGRGRVGLGEIHSSEEEGDEDARTLLIPRDLEDIEGDEENDALILGYSGEEEDGAVRRGRLILRQLYHSTFHLHARLVQVVGGQGSGGRKRFLSDRDVKELAGTKLYVSADEARFWQDLAAEWGFIAGAEIEEDD